MTKENDDVQWPPDMTLRRRRDVGRNAGDELHSSQEPAVRRRGDANAEAVERGSSGEPTGNYLKDYFHRNPQVTNVKCDEVAKEGRKEPISRDHKEMAKMERTRLITPLRSPRQQNNEFRERRASR
jgi:hypothetical protein